MKKLLFVFLLVIPSLVYPQSIRDRLDDIEDQINQMESNRLMDQTVQQYQRNQQQNNSTAPVMPTETYRNSMTNLERIENARMFNLNTSEYIRKDEDATNQCSHHLINQNNRFQVCYYSKMLNISQRETEQRIEKVKVICNSPNGMNLKCVKNILIRYK